MKRMLRPAGALLLLSALFMPAAHAYLTVTGNGTSPAIANGTSFVTTPTAAVFYRPTGEYFFGLNWTIASPGNYSICYGNYRTPDVAPTLTALGSGVGLTGVNVHNVAVVPYSSSTTYALVQADVSNPTILAVAGGGAAGAGALTTTQVSAITKTSLTPVTTGAVAGAGAINSVGGLITGGIRSLCASNDLGTSGMNIAFVGSKVNAGVNNPFGAGTGAANGTAFDGLVGILVGRNATTGAPTIVATGGQTATAARAFDLTSTGSNFIGDAGAVTTCTVGAAGTRYGDYPALWYDSILNRLYVGTTIHTATPGVAGASSSLISVAIYPVTVVPNTSITLGAALKPFSAAAGTGPLVNLVSAAVTGIVAVKSTNAQGAIGVSAQMLRTMHTSTGFVYLLVNGDVGALGTGSAAATAATAGENIYAVPLVGTNAITANGVAAADAIGCFADVRTADYATIAGGAAASFALSTSAAYLVGGNSSLPITAGANVVKDMFVDGDTVYVAAGDGAASATNNPGVYKSQAVFNQNGQIDHWTDWQRVTPNDMAGQTAGGTAANGTDGRADFVAVDGYTGHAWITNSTSLKSNVTQWSQPAVLTQQSGLPAAVNAALPGGLCYSVLDLNTSVTGWGGTTPARITAFGGQEKVCFAITGSASALPLAMNGAYQQQTTQLQTTGAGNVYDYTNTHTFITTSLPAGAGAVISLAYSGWNPDTATTAATGNTVGMFFAGCAGTATTAPGLYAWTWSPTQAGFNPVTTELNDLQDIQYWDTSTGHWSWQLIPNVQGMPVKIASLGGGLHVLTRTATLDRIYSSAKQGTGVALNTSFIVTASSGVAPSGTNSSLASVSQIYDFVISATATAAAATPATLDEQLLILTNDGIYTTSSTTGMQSPSSVAAQAQLQAGWVRIASPTTNGFLTDYITQPGYQRNPQTFWFGNWAVNPNDPNVYNNYIWYQMSRNAYLGSNGSNIVNGTTYTADPTVTATFNGATSFNQTTAPTIYATFPVNARLFYNDGSRRFFIQKNPANDGAYQVLVLPYNLYDYNITANGKAVMSDAAVAQASAFYWMSPIGDTGRLMMGTSNGVIALQ